MKSYTTLRTAYGQDTKNTSSTNLTYGDERMNDYVRRLLSKTDWPFLHRDRRLTTYDPDSTFTVNSGTDVGTAADTILTETGTEVQFETTDTLPAGLSENTRYWLIYQSATTFKVASSLANALAGTAIDITDTGTGTHTVKVKTKFQLLPYDVDLVESVSVDVDGTIYTPKPFARKEEWDNVRYVDYVSDIPERWFVHDGKLGLWPTPATSGNIITLNAKIRVPDLNIADYSTGTIDIVTNGSTKVTGSGTSWTKSMTGRWIRVTHSNTDASSGDHQWYEIVAVESSTILYLGRPYGGRSLTTGAGAAYAIGQMPALPEAYHDLPELYAAYRYWSKEKDTRADGFLSALLLGQGELFTSYGINDLSMVVDSGDGDDIINPNLLVTL